LPSWLLAVESDQSLATARLYLRNAHGARAEALEQLKRHAEAVNDWERVADLDDGQRPRAYYSLKQAVALARAGKPAQALRLAEQVLQQKDLPAAAYYALGCVHALCAGATKDEETAAKAVDLLREAVGKGYMTPQT
jgi:tetratricopeptide (TPR) repeat protein